jgi:hypothetical protein
VVLQACCWRIMASQSCFDVSRNVATGGGTRAAIRGIRSSSITPGPLGMCDTKPSADAPHSIASSASSRVLMQQIFTLGLLVGFIAREYQGRLLRVTRHTEPRCSSPAWRVQGTSGLRPVWYRTSRWRGPRSSRPASDFQLSALSPRLRRLHP